MPSLNEGKHNCTTAVRLFSFLLSVSKQYLRQLAFRPLAEAVKIPISMSASCTIPVLHLARTFGIQSPDSVRPSVELYRWGLHRRTIVLNA
ncbi:hypothetical protein IFM89_014282 [Coptis chinensis]|uniref:Uncharacterized protein n=1 Tax=Coptis chinensis TaxID=261450 RepID=A0A835H489_9MAGN|nr:hypothetical protein IFM89_014282 [Coptis chinensis]